MYTSPLGVPIQTPSSSVIMAVMVSEGRSLSPGPCLIFLVSNVVRSTVMTPSRPVPRKSIFLDIAAVITADEIIGARLTAGVTRTSPAPEVWRKKTPRELMPITRSWNGRICSTIDAFDGWLCPGRTASGSFTISTLFVSALYKATAPSSPIHINPSELIARETGESFSFS